MDTATLDSAPPPEPSVTGNKNEALHRFLQMETDKSPQEILDTFAEGTPQLTAEEFLSKLPSSDLTRIQYFDDTEAKDSRKAIDVDSFNRAFAERKQQEKCGVFFSVNGFQVHRRKDYLKLNRGFYIDWDAMKAGANTPVEITLGKAKMLRRLLLLEGTFVPHIVIETKGGLHCLWLVDFGENFLLPDEYTRHQAEIVSHFDADPGAKDVTRVLRLPGFLHLKDPASPFLIRFLYHDLP